MTGSFSALGFELRRVTDLERCERQARLGQVHEGYRRAEVGGGVELWARLDEQGRTQELSPHYHGEARLALHLEALGHYGSSRVLRARLPQTPWMLPFALLGGVGGPLPRSADAGLCAFTRRARLDSRGHPYALPLHDPERSAFPAPEVLLRAPLRSVRRAINPETQRPFWHLSLSLPGGAIDAVASLRQLKREPLEGDVIEGLFWMSGRVLP
ncbi:hypothetical protein HNR42_003038 [Deinobacterium chartae]|uniref:Uncharacterized protein n=1 Tax=Deinobacterium chartae TaxID=521158 RepID=A0A841I6Y4_9DEIO|nr:hypothetical protein [Deinobacterium chartae]MBB6099585.1 hypothetical protein [Deinobacterium chartae]